MQKVKLSIGEIRERFMAEGADPIAVDIFFEVAKARIDIWREFERLALRVWETGRRKYSAQTIMHVIRWNSDIERGQEEFDINNNYIAYYSRMLMYQYPEAVGFFEIRSFKEKNNGNFNRETVEYVQKGVCARNEDSPIQARQVGELEGMREELSQREHVEHLRDVKLDCIRKGL